MTEFSIETRHYCRNPKCRSKLPKPVSNERDAFCARGCHTAFYRKRCLVCEGPIERSRDDQRTCREAKCRSAWRARTGFGRYIASSDAKLPSKKPVNKGASTQTRSSVNFMARRRWTPSGHQCERLSLRHCGG